MHASPELAKMRGKAPKTTLEVRIGSIVLRHRVAAHVFCEALRLMELGRVAALRLTASGLPLVSRNGPPARNGKPRGYREIDGWFVVTHTSTREKKAILEQAAEALSIPIEVRIFSMKDAAIAELLA